MLVQCQNLSKKLKKMRLQDSDISIVLDDIPNVGQKRRMALLKHFGSVEKIKEASLEELLKIDSIDKKTADSIVNYFNSHIPI